MDRYSFWCTRGVTTRGEKEKRVRWTWKVFPREMWQIRNGYLVVPTTRTLRVRAQTKRVVIQTNHYIIQKRYSNIPLLSYKRRIGLIRCGIIIITVVLRLSHILSIMFLRSNLFTNNKLSYWNLAEIEQYHHNFTFKNTNHILF